jgi:DNA-directed RNA polymerase subunit M
MMPKKHDNEVIFVCHCGYKEAGESKIKEQVKQEYKEIEVAEKKEEILPVVKTKCPHCSHNEAYNWEIQTRAGDEPATQFFKCRKCSHTWREYK